MNMGQILKATLTKKAAMNGTGGNLSLNIAAAARENASVPHTWKYLKSSFLVTATF